MTEDGSAVEQGTVESALEQEKLHRAFKGGGSWFTWIGALSVVNSVIVLFGGEWNFVLGLGITQVIDGIALGIAETAGVESALPFQLGALVIDLGVVGVCVLFGWLACRGYGWAFLVGVAFYVLDALLVLAFTDWLALAFHVFATIMILRGYGALRQLQREGSAAPALAPPTQPQPFENA